MIVIVDERELVKDGFYSLFGREGVAAAGFGSFEFGEWVSSAADEDVSSVHAFAESSIGGWFVGFLIVVFAVCFVAWWKNRDYLRSDNQLDSLVSRESPASANAITGPETTTWSSSASPAATSTAPRSRSGTEPRSSAQHFGRSASTTSGTRSALA